MPTSLKKTDSMYIGSCLMWSLWETENIEKMITISKWTTVYTNIIYNQSFEPCSIWSIWSHKAASIVFSLFSHQQETWQLKRINHKSAPSSKCIFWRQNVTTKCFSFGFGKMTNYSFVVILCTYRLITSWRYSFGVILCCCLLAKTCLTRYALK